MIGCSLTWAHLVLTMVIPWCATATECGDCGAEGEPSNLLQHSIQEAGSLSAGGCPGYLNTAYGKCCRHYRTCGVKAGAEARTCLTRENGPQDHDKWDYCQTTDRTPMGWYCRGDCKNHGKPYRWCYTTNGKWDYCVPEAMDEWKKSKEKAQTYGQACTKWDTDGYHEGTYLANYPANESPDGHEWTWKQCAERCGEKSFCEFWALQLNKEKACLMMSDKKDFHAEPGTVIEGPRKFFCKA